jgi:uncharacterized protein (TIGR02453 family)
MSRIHKDTFKFLKDLKANNNRDWFNDNKKIYSEIREGFIGFLEAIYPRLCEFDPGLKGMDLRKSVFRINRDVRFSNDKSPYKTSIAGVIIEGGRRNFSERAGYYLHLEPENSIIAGGAYLPPSAWIKRIRKEIASDSDSFREIINDKNFVRYFGLLSGDKLKGAPRSYPKDHPDIDLLRYKSYMAVHELSKEEVLADNFGDRFIDVALALKPLNDFLNWEE